MAAAGAALALACGTLEAATGPEHWAFRPVTRPEVPAGNGGSLDRFVSRSLRRHGADLMPEADRSVLIRRLSYDLRGLPPSPGEIAAFVNDPRSDAWERQVEAFLASPQYGERWGRHWLDIAAYADSNGYFNADSDRPLAWKYRDYVVRSIQQDKPIRQFILEQVAGDELVGYARGGDILPTMVEPLIATQFLRNPPDGSGESDGNPLEVKVDKYSVLEGTVQLIGNAFLGLTLQCARCHEHKFEPVTQQEYYALQAILRPAYDPEAWLKPNDRTLVVGTKTERDANEKALKEYERDTKTLREAIDAVAAPFRRQLIDENLARLEEPVRKQLRQAIDTKEKERNDAMKALLKTHAAVVEISDGALRQRFPEYAASAGALQASLERREASKPVPLERIAALHEPGSKPPAHRLLVRGNHATEGDVIEPTVPVSLAGKTGFRPPATGEIPTTGRRLALARWLVADDNPVVARVFVNRVWRLHFGEGLVPTQDNLGRSGASPSDPALLDWLTAEFMRSGWSLKHLHRLILNSAAWKQRTRTEVAEAVPGLLAAGPRRLDAEALRDAMLQVSGELDLHGGGPYVPIKVDGEGQIVVDEKAPGAHRRSMYLQQRRTQPVALLQVFDGPAHNPVCVQRVPSTVALQSLSLLNSEFVRARARAFAKRVRPVGEAPASQGIVAAFEFAFGRQPTASEMELGNRFLQTQSGNYAGRDDAAERSWTDFCQMLLASNEFLYVD